MDDVVVFVGIRIDEVADVVLKIVLGGVIGVLADVSLKGENRAFGQMDGLVRLVESGIIRFEQGLVHGITSYLHCITMVGSIASTNHRG
jgi:hypothetical protein